MMKGWIVSSDYAEGSKIVFADSRNEAKKQVLYSYGFEDVSYIDLIAKRCPKIDGMEKCEPTDNYWLNEDIRLILVREYSWTCIEPQYSDCDSCCAKEYCLYFD